MNMFMQTNMHIRDSTEGGVTWGVGTLVAEIFENLGFWSKIKVGLNTGYLDSFLTLLRDFRLFHQFLDDFMPKNLDFFPKKIKNFSQNVPIFQKIWHMLRQILGFLPIFSPQKLEYWSKNHPSPLVRSPSQLHPWCTCRCTKRYVQIDSSISI